MSACRYFRVKAELIRDDSSLKLDSRLRGNDDDGLFRLKRMDYSAFGTGIRANSERITLPKYSMPLASFTAVTGAKLSPLGSCRLRTTLPFRSSPSTKPCRSGL